MCRILLPIVLLAGILAPLCLPDAVAQDRDREKKQAEEEKRFAGFFPEKVRRDVLGRTGFPGGEEDERVGRKIAAAIGDGEVTAVAVCRALGSIDMTWTTTTEKERRALAAVHEVEGKDFLGALRKLKDDRMGLRGAARVFFREGYHKKVPADVRTEWTVRLAEVVFTDGLDDDKPTLLGFLSRESDPKIKAMLQDVFRGKVGKEIDLKKAFGQEPGLRAGAALCLVGMGDESIKPEIQQLLPKVQAKADVAALEVCLALLGDPSYIKTEHFRLQSYSIGLGGLKAIERFKGKHGMEALVKGGVNHPWGAVNDEAVRTFERITGRKMSRGEIEDWWEVEHEGNRNRPQPVLTLKGNTDQLRCVKFSPDGKWIASGSNDSTAKVWNAQTGDKVHTLRGHTFTVLDVAFHPDGKQLASASGDLTIKIWDLTTGKEVRTLKGHVHMVQQVTFSPDGKLLASAGEDRTIRIWDPTTGQQLRTFKGYNQRDAGLVFRLDGRRIASASGDRTAQIWDPATGEVERTFRGPAMRISSLEYSPDGKQLVAGGGSKHTVMLWDAADGNLLRTLTGHTDYVVSAIFRSDGKHIASTSWDKTVRVWDAATGRALVSFKGHPESINGLAYSPDGKRLATASEDKTIRVWDLEKILKDAAAAEKK